MVKTRAVATPAWVKCAASLWMVQSYVAVTLDIMTNCGICDVRGLLW